jgi:hypothetical protein
MRIAGNALALMLLAGAAVQTHAQLSPAPPPKPMTRVEKTDLREQQPLHTFFLKYSAQPNDGNEILTGLRLMLDPGVKMYLVPKDNAIILKALPEEIATAAALIAELDQPHKTYRLVYTLTEMDGGKKTGTQRYTMTAAAGQRVTLKTGSRVPFSTGRFDVTNDISETQTSYLDVGLNFDSTFTDSTGGGQLKAVVERSSLADEKPASGTPQNPTLRQAVVSGVFGVALGKPLMLGTLDIPDSTRHLEIEVTVEAVP